MRRIALLALASTLLLAQAPKPDPFAPVRFLAGQWTGEGAGDPGKGSGAFSFRFDLDGRALIRQSVADYPAQGGRPAAHHADLITTYAEGDALRALYLDNEGHVIHYTVAAVPDGAVFLSEAGPGPRFRLTYRTTGPNRVHIRFEIAPPGKPEAFATYVEGASTRS
jgi:hypothetical protein